MNNLRSAFFLVGHGSSWRSVTYFSSLILGLWDNVHRWDWSSTYWPEIEGISCGNGGPKLSAKPTNSPPHLSPLVHLLPFLIFLSYPSSPLPLAFTFFSFAILSLATSFLLPFSPLPLPLSSSRHIQYALLFLFFSQTFHKTYKQLL